MPIKANLTEAMKAAMRAKDKPRLEVIRLILAAFKQKEVDERIEVSDEIALQIMDKMLKQRRDSLQQFADAGREDLVSAVEFELSTLQEFMPKALSATEIESIIVSAIKDSGASGIKDMGTVMAALKPKMQGRADMGSVSNLVKQHLSE